MIVHGQTGMLYQEQQEEQLASQLEELVKRPDKRKALGMSARQFAEENYSNDMMFTRYKKLYCQ